MESKGFLLDTTILIDLFRGHQNAIVFLDKLSQEGSLFICPISVAEIFSGIRPQELPKIEDFFEAINYCTIEYRTAKRAGLYRRDYRKKGVTLSISDTKKKAYRSNNHSRQNACPKCGLFIIQPDPKQ